MVGSRKEFREGTQGLKVASGVLMFIVYFWIDKLSLLKLGGLNGSRYGY